MGEDYLPLGCFGKLPCYADFLTGKVFLPTSLAFKDWVFKGRGGAGGGAADDGEIASPAAEPSVEGASEVPPPRPEIQETCSYRFLFGLPGSAELLAGVIRPSVDSGSRRRFPFVVFAHFPRHAYARHYELAPLGLAPTWEALDDAWNSLANVATRPAFEEVLPAMSVPAPTSVEASRQAYRTRLAAPARQALEGRGARLDDLIAFVPEILKHLKKKGEGELLVVDLPGGNGEEGLFEAAFWIDLLNHQFFLRRFEPLVFVQESGAGRPARLLFVFGGLDAAAYPVIMAESGGEPMVLRPTPAAPGVPTTLVTGEPTFQELLGRRFRGAA